MKSNHIYLHTGFPRDVDTMYVSKMVEGKHHFTLSLYHLCSPMYTHISSNLNQGFHRLVRAYPVLFRDCLAISVVPQLGKLRARCLERSNYALKTL